MIKEYEQVCANELLPCNTQLDGDAFQLPFNVENEQKERQKDFALLAMLENETTTFADVIRNQNFTTKQKVAKIFYELLGEFHDDNVLRN